MLNSYSSHKQQVEWNAHLVAASAVVTELSAEAGQAHSENLPALKHIASVDNVTLNTPHFTSHDDPSLTLHIAGWK